MQIPEVSRVWAAVGLSGVLLVVPVGIRRAPLAAEDTIIIRAEVRLPAGRSDDGVIVVLDPDPTDLAVGIQILTRESDREFRIDGLTASGHPGELYIVAGKENFPLSPHDGQFSLELDTSTMARFKLDSMRSGTKVRPLTFWKHQANLYLRGSGEGEESRADMESAYPAGIFQRFHNNPFGNIQVSAVTCSEGPASRGPITLETMHQVFTKAGKGDALHEAKQQLLALLLNVVSEKIEMSRLISEDGATVGGSGSPTGRAHQPGRPRLLSQGSRNRQGHQPG